MRSPKFNLLLLFIAFINITATYSQNYSLHFNAAAGGNDTLSVANDPNLASRDWTIEFWAKKDASSGNGWVLSAGNTTQSAFKNLHIGFRDNNTFSVDFFTNALDYDAPSNFDTNWHHWAVTNDFVSAASNTRKIYLDGVLVKTDAAPVPAFTGAANLYIGKLIGDPNLFRGTLDELKIWDYVLTHSEIASSMTNEVCPSLPGLLLYYNFNIGKTSGVNMGLNMMFDLTDNNRNATLHNFSFIGTTSNWITNGFPAANPINLQSLDNKSLWFNGNSGTPNDQVLFPNGGPSLNNSSFTIEFWAKRNLLGQSWIFSMGNTGTTNNQMYAGFDDNNTFRFSFGSNDLNYDAPANFDFNWHHWACVFQTGVGKKIYLDGVLVASDNQVSVYTGNSTFRLGGLATTSSGRSTVTLDEFRIWNTAKTLSDIQLNKNCEIAGNSSGLQAYYQFNHGNSNGNNNCFRILYDLSTNNYSGKLSSFDLSILSPNYSNWNQVGFQPNSISFTTQPKSFVKAVGGTVVFSAVAANSCGPLSYQWYKNNTIIPGAIGTNFTINNLQIADAGEYHVVVTDSVRTAKSRIGFLAIEDTELIATVDSSDAYIDVNWSVPVPACMLDQNNQPYTSYTTRLLRNGSEVDLTTYTGGNLSSVYNDAIPLFHKTTAVKNGGQLNLTIILPNTSGSIATDYSMELWVKTKNDGGKQILHQNGGLNRTIELNNNKVSIYSQGGVVYSTPDLGLTSDSWNHFAFVFKAADGKTDVYVNGQLKATLNIYFEMPSFNAFLKNTTSTYHPQLGELRYWSKAMSSSEVSTNYKFLPPTNNADLICRFRFTETSTTMVDLATQADGIVQVLVPNNVANIETLPYFNSSVLSGTYRDFQAPNTTRNYTLQLYHGTLGQQDTDCSPWIVSGETSPLQGPSLMDATDTLLDRIIVKWKNNSNLASSFKLYRNNQLIATITEGIAKGDTIIYEDIFNHQINNSIQSGVVYNYTIKMISTQLGNQEFPFTIGNGQTYSIGFNASDAPAFAEKVQLIWNDDAMNEIDEYQIWRDGNLYRVIVKDQVAFDDLFPVNGDTMSYELRLIKAGSTKAIFKDKGNIAPSGAISGRVLTIQGLYPVGNVQVMVTRPSTGQAFNILSNASGVFNFNNIPFGIADSFVITATLSGHVFTYPVNFVKLSRINNSYADFIILDNFVYNTVSSSASITNFVATPQINQDKVDLSWTGNGANAATLLDILRNEVVIHSLSGTSVNNGSFIDLSGIPEELSEYKIRMYTISGNNVSESSQVAIVSYPPVSKIPTGQLTAALENGMILPNGNISLNWTHTSTNISGFRIYRNGELLGELASNVFTYSDKSAPFATNLSYTITAIRTVNDITFETKVPTLSTPGLINLGPFPTPVNVVASPNATLPGVVVTWQAPSGIGSDYNYSGYYIYRGTERIAKIHKTQSLTYTDKQGFGATNVSYKVSTFKLDTNGDEVESAQVSSIPVSFPGFASVPTLTAVTNNSTKMATLSWNASAYATNTNNFDGYILYFLGDEIGRVPSYINTFTHFPPFDQGLGYTLKVYKRVNGNDVISTVQSFASPGPITTPNSDGVLEPQNVMVSRNLPNHTKICWEYLSFVNSEFEIFKEGISIDTVQSGGRAYFDYNASNNDPTINYEVRALNSGLASYKVGDVGDKIDPKNLRGVVKDNTTGLGIANAEIKLTINGVTTTYGFTNSAGFYFITLNNEVEGLPITILVTPFNISNALSATVTFNSNDEIEQNFQFNDPFPDLLEEVASVTSFDFNVDSFALKGFLSWKMSSNNFTGLQILRGVNEVANILPGQNMVYSDPAAVPGIKYSYFVRPYKDDSNGRTYGNYFVRDGSLPKIAMVSNFSGTPLEKENAIRLQFSHPYDHADGYVLLRNDELIANLLTGQPFVYDDHGGTAGQSYNYTAMAYKNVEGITYFSDRKTITVSFPKAAKIQGLTAFELTENNVVISPTETEPNFELGMVKLSWNYPGTNAAFFKLYRDGEFLSQIDKDSTSYIDDKGIPQSDYLYELSAVVSQNGVLTESEKVSVSFIYPEPSRPYELNVITQPTLGNAVLTFKHKSSGINYFIIQKFGPPLKNIDTIYVENYIGNTEINYTDITGKININPYYRIYAVVDDGNISFTSAFSQININTPDLFPDLPPVQNLQGDFTSTNIALLTWDYDPEIYIDYFRVEIYDASLTSPLETIVVSKNQRSFSYSPINNELLYYRFYAVLNPNAYNVNENLSGSTQIGGQLPFRYGDLLSPPVNSHMGYSVAVDGKWAVSGNWRDQYVSIYEFDSTQWVFHSNIENPASPASIKFGFSVDISGNTLVVGAPEANNNDGRIYIYEFNTGTNTWVFDEFVTTSGGKKLGWDVAIDGDLLAGGRPLVADGGSPLTITLSDYPNSVSVYKRGATWSLVILSPPTLSQLYIADEYYFRPNSLGFSVDVDGSKVVMGDYSANAICSTCPSTLQQIQDVGMSVVYDINLPAGTGSFVDVFSDEDALGNSPGLEDAFIQFGYDVATEGDYVISSARHGTHVNDPGAVYIHKNNGASTYLLEQTLNTETPNTNARYGHSVDIKNGIVAVSKLYEQEPESVSKVYIYSRNNNTGNWDLIQSPVPASSQYRNDLRKKSLLTGNDPINFGWEVAMSADHIIMGASDELLDLVLTQSNLNRGTTYIFELHNDIVKNVNATDGSLADTKISWVNDCDHCPANYVENYRVYRNGELIVDDLPSSNSQFFDTPANTLPGVSEAQKGVVYYYEVEAELNTVMPMFTQRRGDMGYSKRDGKISGNIYVVGTTVGVPGVKVIASGIDTSTTMIFTDTVTTASDGSFAFTNLFYPVAGIEYNLRAEFLDHEFSNPNPNNPFLLNPTSSEKINVVMYDNTVYVVEGMVKQANSICGIDDVSVKYYKYINGIKMLEDSTRTVDGAYTLFVDPRETNLTAIEIGIDNVQQQNINNQLKTVKHLFTTTGNVFSNFTNFAKVHTVDFTDELAYPVTVKVLNTCGNALANQPVEISLSAFNGCQNLIAQTNSNGTVVVQLVPENYLISVRSLVGGGVTNYENSGINYLQQRPITLNLYDTHINAGGNTLPTIEVQKFIYHTATLFVVSDTFTRNLCNDPQMAAISVQGSENELELSLYENHRPGEVCDVTDGYIIVNNSAAETEFDTIYAGNSQFPPYIFTTGAPNLIPPHLLAISFNLYNNNDQFLSDFTLPIVVEGNRMLPGTGVEVSANEDDAGNIQMPLFILRDPPGDGSSATIEAGTEVTKSFTISDSETSTTGVISSGTFTSFGVGLFFDASNSETSESNNEKSWDFSMSTTQAFSTSGDEGAVGRPANIVVGAGISTQYGISQKLFFADNCTPTLKSTISYGLSGFENTWAYTVEFMENLIDKYRQDSIKIRNGSLILIRSNGEEYTEQEAIDKTTALINAWTQVLHYHDVETLPHYVFCSDTEYEGENPLAAQEYTRWREGFCNMIGHYEGDEFIMNEEIEWTPILLNSYNNAVAATNELKDLLTEVGATLLPELFFSPIELVNPVRPLTLQFHNLLGSGNKSAEVYDISGNVTFSKSVSAQQSASTSYSYSLYSETNADLGVQLAQTISPGGFGTVLEFDISIGANINNTSTLGTSKSQAVSNSSNISYEIFDDDAEDQLSFIVIQPAMQNHTPFFLRLGGISSCPAEEALTPNQDEDPLLIDDPNIAVVIDPVSGATTSNPPTLHHVPANQAAIFTVQLGSNPGPTNLERDYTVFLDLASNPFGAIVKLGGNNLNQVSPTYSILSGGSITQILTIERPAGTPFYEFENILIGIEPACGGEAKFISVSVNFKSPCSPVSLTQPFEGYIVNRQNPVLPNDKEFIPIEIRDYQSFNTNLAHVELQYRRLGSGQNWQGIPGGFLTRAQLAAHDATLAEGQEPNYYFEWDITNQYGLYPDGDYLIRAMAFCGTSGQQFSNEVMVSLLRTALITTGTPQPSDGIWTNGDEINASYSTDLDCSVILNQDSIQDYLSLIDLSTMMAVPFEFTCVDHKLELTTIAPMSNYDGHTLRAGYVNLANVAGNVAEPLIWDFDVVTQSVDWVENNFEVTLYDDEVKNITTSIMNTTGNSVNNLSLLENVSWLSVSPASTFSVPSNGGTATLTIDGSAAGIGNFNTTISIQGLSGRIPIITLTVHVVQRPPIPAIDPNLLDSMKMVLNWSFVDPYLTSVDTLDQISVYKDGEIRGFGNIKKQGLFYAANVTVYGNDLLDNGEMLDFAIWNADEAIGYSPINATNVVFEKNNIIGAVANPLVLLVDNELFEYGDRIYVDSSNVSGAHDGFTWATAFHRLSDALSIANAGDTIWMAKGMYYPTTGTDRNLSFVINNGVAIYGGFLTGNTSLNQRTGTNHSILSGDIGAVNTTSDNSYHVVKINANNTLLDMVTIQGGNANGAGQDGYGGCIYNTGDASLVGCIVRQGTALSGGNLIFNDGMLKLIGGLYNIPLSSSISTLYNAVGSGIEVMGNVQIKH